VKVEVENDVLKKLEVVYQAALLMPKVLEGVDRISMRLNRNPGKQRRRFGAEVAERCQEIWEMARMRQVVRMGAKRKVSHADAFAYARGKLGEIGIKTVGDFEAALGAYSDRKVRERRGF